MKDKDNGARELLSKLGSSKLQPKSKDDAQSLNSLLVDMMKSAGGSEEDIKDAMSILKHK